jgi:hypothetical protein
MLEKEIENIVVTYAKSKGFLAYKFNSPANRSVPDRMFISPTGTIGFIEFKQKGKKLTKLQQHTCNELNNRNIDVRRIDDIILGRLIIDEWLQVKSNPVQEL